MADTGTTRDRVWGSVTNERDEVFMATVALLDVLQHCLQVERTAVAVPSSISNSQLRPPSLIAYAPLKLWLKLLDFETLKVLHNKSVAASAKAKLLGQRDETAYHVNRIREATHRELEYRRTKPPTGEGPALGSQAQQS